ncbi:MAG: FkbM family methyltransferase [Acidimicrobiia bacterium]|nr:FkbM family methyltransferase [Acidimicrobiia bacterium]
MTRAPAATTISADGHEHVPSVTLDGLYLPHVGLLWVDAEGSEGQVFAGARDLLRSRPPIVMEFKPESLRAHGGLETVMNVASMYAERVYTHGRASRSTLSASRSSSTAVARATVASTSC